MRNEEEDGREKDTVMHLPERTEAVTPLWVVAGLAMAPTIALGLARFAYALLLPAMRHDLHWSFANAGAMNTANAAGYLVGALTAAPLARMFGSKPVFAIALLATALSVMATGASGMLSVLLALRFAAGLAGAMAFVIGAGLASAATAEGSPSRSQTVLAIYFAGGGAGIAASALAVPPLLVSSGWHAGWLALGALSLVATFFAWAVLHRTPAPAMRPATTSRGGWSARFMFPLLLSYGLYGAGYSSYSTFVIAFLRTNGGLSEAAITAFWAVLGLSSIAAAFAWGPLLGRLKGGWGTVATVGVVTIGAAFPLVLQGAVGAYVSAVMFGGAFLAVIAAVTSFARRAAEPHAWTAAIAALTTTFGIGQCAGPVLSGALSDGSGGITEGLWLSIGLLVLACIAAALQIDPSERQS